MENSRKVFLNEINGFISSSKKIQDKDIIKQKYLDLVKKYHPDVNNEIDKNILNEYMIIINNSYEELMNNTISKKQENTENNDIGGFNFDLFILLLEKITGRGINKENIKDKVFNGYKNLLLTEIEKSSKYAGKAFNLLFSGKIISKYSEKIDLFNNGITHYMYLLKRIPSSTKEKYKNMPDIRIANKQGQDVADSYLAEYKEYCKKKEEKDAIEVLKKWFKETHEKYCKIP
jgi:hypothetical protein